MAINVIILEAEGIIFNTGKRKTRNAAIENKTIFLSLFINIPTTTRNPSIKENIDVRDNDSIHSKVIITMFSLFAELEKILISQRTKEALATLKANGKKLGRPKGQGKSICDKHLGKIQEYLDLGVSIASIAKIIDIKYVTLVDYIKRKKLKKKE